MHRDGLKSDAYGSLRRPLPVGCEDFERAVFGRSGKSRTPPPLAMGLYPLNQRGHEDAGASYIVDREEEGAMACRGNSDLQLRYISREAQKLNQMIDSWSKSPSFDGRSTDIAADLLRGALDLQESLCMLGRIQEASNFMAETRRKQSYNAAEEEEMVEMGMELMGSRRFESSTYQGTLQARRIPVDESSRNCREELKKVISASLYRQNLVSISAEDEKASSSRSLKHPLRNGFGETCGSLGLKTESSRSAGAGHKKAKAPNLIARLMGLEEPPSVEFQPAVRSEPERRKNPVQPRHFFDIEMPKASKPPSPVEKPEPGRKTLKEIIEAMQFKGLLRADLHEEPRARSPVEQCFRWLHAEGEAPPIVIIKPMHSAGLKMEMAQQGHLMEANHTSTQEKGQFSRAMEEEVAPKSISPKEIENRAGRSVAKDKVEAPRKNKISASYYLRQSKKETNRMNKKPDEMQKPVPDRGRLENRSVRPVAVLGSQTKATSSTPIRKLEPKRPGQVKNHVSLQTSSSNHVDHRSTRPATRKAVDTAKGTRTTKARPVKERTIPMEVGSPNSKEENKEIIPAQEKIIHAMSSTLPSNIHPKRDPGKEPSFHCEVMPKGSHGGGIFSPAHAPKQHAEEGALFTVPAESAEQLKWLLLRSPAFLSHAQELFDVYVYQPVDFCREDTTRIEKDNYKLLLDCSCEWMASRSHRLELLNYPLSLSSLKHLKTKISISLLVDEISEEIENVRGYSKGGDAVKDGLYGRLERDLKCNRVFARGVWDCGWIEIVPVEEADGIACDVEKHVMSRLIEEIALEFMR